MLLHIAAAFLSGVLAQETPIGGGFGGVGGGLLGSNPCTYSPNATCYPNPVQPGRPICCTIDPTGQSCDPAGEPCFDPIDIPADFNISNFNITDLPIELGPGPVIIGGGLLGSDICTYSPNITCFPNTDGVPPCCADSTCTSEYPPCEEPAIMGGNICTYSPDDICWPSNNGRPPCCANPSTCPSPSEFEAGVNPPCEELPGSSYCTDTPDTECYHMGQPACCFVNQLECPAEKPGCDKQPGLDGGNICTYSPDEVCWPSTNGWPPCCVDPSSCPSPSEFEAGVNPPCEELPGSSYCNDTPDTECYHMGQPACCFINQLECPAEKPGCDKQPGLDGGNICTYSPDEVCWPSTNGWPPCCADPSSCPSPSEFEAGVNPPCEGPATIPGSNPCTYSPDKECYPSNNGWPMCCKETPDGSSCSKEEPCENSEFVTPTPPAPSPASGEPAIEVDEAKEAPSSSTFLGLSLITFVGAHAVAIVAGMMW